MCAHVHRVLLVDDNLDESFLTHRVLRRILASDCTINVAASGDEAIAYLMGEGKFADRTHSPFPTLLISDLEMSPGDGFDVLEFMQSNPGWSVVPRVIFSSSSVEAHIETAYSLGASAYHIKPLSGLSLEKLLRDMLVYWSSAEVPPVDPDGHIKRVSRPPRLARRYPRPTDTTLHRMPAHDVTPVAENTTRGSWDGVARPPNVLGSMPISARVEWWCTGCLRRGAFSLNLTPTEICNLSDEARTNIAALVDLRHAKGCEGLPVDLCRAKARWSVSSANVSRDDQQRGATIA